MKDLQFIKPTEDHNRKYALLWVRYDVFNSFDFGVLLNDGFGLGFLFGCESRLGMDSFTGHTFTFRDDCRVVKANCSLRRFVFNPREVQHKPTALW